MFSTIPSLIAKAFPGSTGPTPPPGWTPADLTGVYLWLDATNGITTSGGLVTDWVDQISSKTFSSTTTDKFTYNSSDAVFNNLPTLEWAKTNTGAGCKLLNTDITYNAEDLFYWGVYSVPTLNFSESMLFSIAEGGGISYQTMFIGAGPQKPEFLVLGGGERNTSTYPLSFNTPRFFIGRRQNTSPYTNTLWDNRTTPKSLNQDGSFTPATLKGTVGNEFVGGGLQYQFSGKIAELGWCRGTVTNSEVTELINYLTTKYSITPPLLLNDFTGAVWAFSLRKLNTAYSGSAIRVRRSSDDAEQDIGFVSGVLDTDSLLTFCAGSDGYVKIWYDQSGNGNNATQTNSANQPQIVSGGVINTVSGLGAATPAIRMYGSDDFFDLPFVPNAVTQGTVFSVNKTVSTGGGFWNYNNNLGGATHHPWSDNNSYEGFGSESRYGFSSEGLFVNQHLYTVMSKTNDWRAFINGVSKYTSGSNTVYFPKSAVGVTPKLGSDWQGQFWYNGFYQEHIFYPSDVLANRTGIEENINYYYNIY